MKNENTEWRLGFNRLQKEKDTRCLSIVLPAHRIFPERKVEATAIRRLLADVKEQLQEHIAGDETEHIFKLLEKLTNEVKFRHTVEGIGLFVSKNIQQWVSFYLPVKEKVLIADRFDKRDLLYQDFFAMPYHVLLLSTTEARLFTGVFDQLTEVGGPRFPMKFEDDYEYSHPGRGLTYEGHAVTKDFEREKSRLKEIREERFLQQVDALMKASLATSDPLFIAGTEKELGYFGNLTTFTNIIGRLHGNFFYLSVPAIGESTWRMIKSYLENKKQEHIRAFKEKLSRDEAVSGITDCWQAAFQGKGAFLLLEKDFSRTGYQPIDRPDHLNLEPPEGSYKVLPDAVSALIELVQERGGEVLLVEENALNHFQHIGLITRYA